MSWTRNISDYSLIPDQSLLAAFNEVRDVLDKAELGNDFWKEDHKQTMATKASC